VSLAKVSAGNKLTQTYTRDRVGNITAITAAALYRLTNANYPGTANDQSFTYDAVGNRLTKSTVTLGLEKRISKRKEHLIIWAAAAAG
jgi:hypothetical protein